MTDKVIKCNGSVGMNRQGTAGLSMYFCCIHHLVPSAASKRPLCAEFQHPCRDRNDSHTLIQCTVDLIYWSACVIIYFFHICTRAHAYSDRLQT